MSRAKILIVSESNDYHAKVIGHELEKNGIAFRRFNTDEVPHTAEATWHLSSHPETNALSNQWFEDSVSTVWDRRRTTLKKPDSHIEWFIHEESAGLTASLLQQYTHCRWVSRPDKIHSARSKPQTLTELYNLFK